MVRNERNRNSGTSVLRMGHICRNYNRTLGPLSIKFEVSSTTVV